MAWVLGASWGALVLVPLAGRARRVAAGRRMSDLRSPDRASTRAAAPHRFAGVRGAFVRSSGPVARVAGALVQRRRRSRDAVAVERALPVTIDLLGVAVGAGSTPYLAVETVTPWAPPAVASWLGGVGRSCHLGASFADALDELVTVAPALGPLADALLASDRFGAPVGDALGRLAAEGRMAVRRRAETRARTVPVRLLFPLVFLVLPAFGLLTVAPTLLTGFGAR